MQCSVLREQPQVTEESFVIEIVTPATCIKYTSPRETALLNSCPPTPAPAQRKAALREFLACLCMPTHHYNHIFIRTQFLGQVLAALLAACSQQIAWACDLLVETGRRKCCRDAGGQAASRPGMNLESLSLSLAAYSQADVGQALRGFLQSFQPCASLSLCLFLPRAQAGSPPDLSVLWGPS